MIRKIIKKLGVKSLRSYITIVITSTVLLIVIICGAFFYQRTYQLLHENQSENIVRQLHQVNTKVEEQFRYIDSIYSTFLSNNLIHDALEPAGTLRSDQLAIERQMSYLMINSYLWQENYINAIYIFGQDKVYRTFSSSVKAGSLENNQKVLALLPEKSTSLVIRSLEEAPDALYFTRNIFSMNSGRQIATIIIEVNKNTLIRHFTETTGPDWLVYIYNQEMELTTRDNLADKLPGIRDEIALIQNNKEYLTDVTVGDEVYLLAANALPLWDMNFCVAAPKTQLYQDLNNTLKTYLWVLAGIIAAAILLSVLLSGILVRPIQKMIYYIDKVSDGQTSQVPEFAVFSEFNGIVTALNRMLNQLNTYYEDNLEKHMLLKNAEIHELQAQMDPHFLFNTLNTIAWKAQIAEDEEVYQMVISMGEMLKSNIYTRNATFITLEDELNYVRFYTYLQKMRFEDKITVSIQAAKELYHYYIPCFCIQPLVENSFIHGLEPKKGDGRLIINIIAHEETMEISVIDDGIGFSEIPDIHKIQSSTTDTHTHIGLKNLDRRLLLLFGENARLKINSTPGVCTIISFTIPLKKEV